MEINMEKKIKTIEFMLNNIKSIRYHFTVIIICVDKVLKTPKKLFTITSFTTGSDSSLILNLRLKI